MFTTHRRDFAEADHEANLQIAQQLLELCSLLLASVTMRMMRFTHLSRNRPDEPAEVGLTRHEVDAAILVIETKRVVMEDGAPVYVPRYHGARVIYGT